MGIPIICLSFFSNIKEFENFIVDKNLSIIFITTFFAAYFTISLFIKVINKIGFTPFVIYRILLGLILLIYLS
jgi:undecaprenyl-diphosphatase